MKNFNAISPHKDVIKRTDEEHGVWSLPVVEDDVPQTDDKTNALGKKATWRYEPPEEIEEEPQPLTAEEIEEIRQAAYEEGFSQGKEEGFAKGYEEGKASGFEEGKTKGHEEGVAQGLEEGREQIQQLAQQWQGLISQLHRPIEVVENNVEQQLVHLVAQLAEAITFEEAKTNPDILLRAVSEGMKALPSKEANTQVLLHPDDIAIVVKKFGEAHINEEGWRILAAPHLDRGSCQIENSTSNIDLSIKARLKDVLDSFLQEALHQK
ncbi:flagellar assembly protein FliH [Thalassotalea fusca]